MEFSVNPTTVFVIAVLIAVTTQLASAHMKFPPIFLWLLAGMALGPFGLHVLHAELIEPALHTLIELGLAVILFEGGLNLNLKALRENGWVVGRMLLFGPLSTMLFGGLAAHALTDLSWSMSLLFGAIVAVGGPTVISPIVRQVRLDRNVSHILSSEAMLVDAIGAIIAIVMLQVVITSTPDVASTMQEVMFKFIVGAGIGIAGGWILSRLLISKLVQDQELRTIFTLAAAWGLFLLAGSISAQAGLLAVLIAGATMQRMELPDIHRLRNFKASLSILLISVLFVLLAASLNLSLLKAYLWQGIAVFLVLALVARPVMAWFSTVGTNIKSNQRAYLAAMAPRGVVAAGITSLFALLLNEKGIPGAEIMLALVYIVIIISVFIYGFMAAPLSRWLKVTGGNDRSVLIIGGGQIGGELGRVLNQDREVRFLDLNTETISSLKRGGFMAVRGNALDPLYMEIVHAEEVSAALVMTGSSDHNMLIANLVKNQFHVPEIYVALQEGDEQKHASLMHQLQARRLFAKPYTFSYWQDQAVRKRLVYETQSIEEGSKLIGIKLTEVRIPHGVQPLAVVRDKKTLIPHDDLLLAKGDEIIMLLRPERIQEGRELILPPAEDQSTIRNPVKKNAST